MKPRLPAVVFSLLGFLLLAVCLYWNRIALGGPLGQASTWVRTFALPISVAVESALGPIEAPGADQVPRVRQFVGSWTIASAIYLLGCYLALVRWRGDRLAFEIILAFSILFRLVLLASPPLLETDPRRYAWDGAVTAAGLDPFRYAPLEVLAYRQGLWTPDAPSPDLDRLAELSRDPRLEPHFLRINHPNVPTVYPPVAQLGFSLAARLAPGELMALKAVAAFFDLAILAALLALLRAAALPDTALLLYGWCPLALKEYAQTGHYDPMATFFLLASLLALLRGHQLLAGLLGGIAASAKLFPLVAGAVLVRRYGLRGVLAGLLAMAALASCFAGSGARGLDGYKTFGMQWVGNASVFALLQSVAGPTPARVLCAIAIAIGLLILLPRPEGTARQVLSKAYAALAVLFVFSPVQNPWYAGWVLPAAILAGSIAWPVLAVTSIVYYAYFTTGGYERLGVDLRWLEYLPFFALLAVESLPTWGAASEPPSGASRRGSPPSV